jgi:hypothetical protein
MKLKTKKNQKQKLVKLYFQGMREKRSKKKKKSSPLATNHTTMMTRITPTRKGHSGVSNNMMEEYF